MTHIDHDQSGSVLLEALIAILVFSIGVLALVGMQATAITTVSDAKYRSTAGFLANQMIGTIRATRLANTAVLAASNVTVSVPDPTFACDPCNGSTGNTFTQAWVASGVAMLPNSVAVITVAGADVTVDLTWNPPDAASGAAPHRHVVTTSIY